MKQKRLLAILGSPHQDGATAKMLDCAVRSAEKCGWHIDMIRLYEKHISFCRGCRLCLQTGKCLQDDDIHEIAALLQDCDVVALASPIYWANVPAIVKNLFDRLLGTAITVKSDCSIPQPKLLSTQKYLLLTACKTPFPFSILAKQSTSAIHSMKTFFKLSGMKSLGAVTFSGVTSPAKLPHNIEKRIESFWKLKQKNQKLY